MTTCPTCDGRRIVTVSEPEKAKTVTYLNANGYPCWPADGGKPVIDWYETGRMVSRNYQCESCHGTGTVECAHCLDTGEYPISSTYGDYAGTMHCHCETGQAKLSADECDAMYAHAAFAGHTPANPPLSDEPF